LRGWLKAKGVFGMKVSINSVVLSLCLIISSAFGQEEIDTSKHVYEGPMPERVKQIIKEHQQRTPEQIERRRNIFKEGVKSKVRDIDFWGKIVDFDGNPVPDAIVVISVRNFDSVADVFFSSKKHELKTDSKGLFEFQGKGMSVSIREISKAGYEYKYEFLETSHFDYTYKTISRGIQNVPFKPDPDAPFTFKIRKRGTVEYLWTNSLYGRFSKVESVPVEVVLLARWADEYGIYHGTLDKRGKGYRTYDENGKYRSGGRGTPPKQLHTSCQFNEDYSAFDLTFQYLGDNGGLIVSDEMLYEAPSDGYFPEVHISNPMKEIQPNFDRPVNLHGKKKYLYVKGLYESEVFYSRIELELYTQSHEPQNPHQSDSDVHVIVRGKIYTNPAGSRWLEYKDDFNRDEEDFRKELAEKCYKARLEAAKNKQPFDEKAFKEKVDKERQMKKEETR
jgi:hypothetical protein